MPQTKLELRFNAQAFEQLQQLHKKDKAQLGRVFKALEQLRREALMLHGVEALKHELTGFYSCRIDAKNRIVFLLNEDEQQQPYLYIVRCHGHYQDK